MSYLKVFVVAVLGFFAVGCSSFATLGVGSSRLATYERESTLDKMDSVQGIAAGDGKHMSRQEYLAREEVKNRQIQAEKNKGLKVEVANYSRYPHSFEIRKASIILPNPIRTSILLPADTVKIIYLMPGPYEVTCRGRGNIYSRYGEAYTSIIWRKIYEVTSAICYDEISGEEVNLIIGNIDDSRQYYPRRPVAKK